MKLQGKCQALRIYVDEDLKWKGKPLYHAILEMFLQEGFAGCTLFKGLEGYGSSAHIHSLRILDVIENLPVVLELVDKPIQVKKALKKVEPMLPPHGLVTVHAVNVLHYHRAAKKK
jgi:PII-like signaling protein